MRQLNQSPTSNSVVVETMKKAQRIAEEAHKYNIAVTHDPAIAKVAMQIQMEGPFILKWHCFMLLVNLLKNLGFHTF